MIGETANSEFRVVGQNGGAACQNGGCADPGLKICIPNGTMGSAPGTVCSDGTLKACGKAGQPCCENRSCGGDACCVNSTCIAAGAGCGAALGKCSETDYGACGTCGGLNQPCCSASSSSSSKKFCTAANLVCNSTSSSGVCKSCGAAGEPCCENNVCFGLGCCGSGTCKSPGQQCYVSSSSGTCSSGGSCGTSGNCGGVGQSECTFIDCTAPYAYSTSITCNWCGSEGQPCCGGTQCGPGLACGTSYPYSCVKCGLLGQPCCDMMFCIAGSCSSTTSSGKCS